jgi:hypothetical protein
LPGIVNYFLGNDPSQWHTRIPTYAQVQYDEVYPGIGLVYYVLVGSLPATYDSKGNLVSIGQGSLLILNANWWCVLVGRPGRAAPGP